MSNPNGTESGRLEKKIDRSELRQYLPKSIAAIITGMIIIAFYFMIKNFSGLRAAINTANRVLLPFFIGFVLAFLMNPIMEFFEKRLKKLFLKDELTDEKRRKKKHSLRIWSSILALIVLIGLIVLFFYAVTPQIFSSISFIVNNIVDQLKSVLDWADGITGQRFHDALMNAKESENIENFLNTVVDYVRQYLNWGEQSEMVAAITSSAMQVGRYIVAFFVGLVAALYILIDKERFKGQTKKIVFGVFSPKIANIIMEVARKARSVFYGFIVGKIIDSLIVGVICYISMLVLNMPYPVLVAVIIGVTNIIPVFGPYIGAVPTVIIIFFMNPTKGIIFLVYIIILQQIDGNFIGPKVLGDSTGLSAFWVLFAITVGGGLFGIIGMLIGVPTMAMIYYIFQRIFNHLAYKRGLPVETESYYKADIVDPETRELVMMKPVEKTESRRMHHKKQSDVHPGKNINENNEDNKDSE